MAAQQSWRRPIEDEDDDEYENEGLRELVFPIVGRMAKDFTHPAAGRIT